ncbi:MAG: ABC transporter ATP-binding protein [Chloroflexota bacterium]
MEPIIEITNYSWKYPETEKPALDMVNLQINKGEFIGIIGPNGAGKTTLALSMNGLIPGQYHGIKQGEVKVLGREVEEYSKGELQMHVGMVFSDPEAQFTAMTVEDELVFGLENLGLTRAEIKERLDWVVQLTDLQRLLNKPPYEISGGQKQRVALAAVLAMMPEVMVLDEPTSMLDPLSRKRIYEVLRQLRETQRHTIIMIEHSLENLIPLTDRMILLSDGKVVMNDETRKFFQAPDLLDKGVYPSEVIQYFHALKGQGLYESEIPITLDEAVEVQENLLALLKVSNNMRGTSS